LVRQVLADGKFDLLVVHGGDGTINESLQELSERISAGDLPGGTANVLARDLGLPFGSRRLASLISRGASKRVSVGRAGKRYFFLMAGIGLDASIVKRVNYALKRRFGLLPIGLPAFASYSTGGLNSLPCELPESITPQRLPRLEILQVMARAEDNAAGQTR